MMVWEGSLLYRSSHTSCPSSSGWGTKRGTSNAVLEILEKITQPEIPHGSPVYFIEGSRVSETAVPHLIDNLDCMDVVFTLRSAHDRPDCPPSNTVLMVIREGKDLVPKELVGPPAFTAEVARPNLHRLVKPITVVRPVARGLTSVHAAWRRSSSSLRLVLNLRWS